MKQLVMQDGSVRIVDFPETPVAALEHRGAIGIDDSIRRFIAWRKQAGLPPSTHATFNIIHPGVAGENFDICVATDAPAPPNADGIVGKIIEAGRCAVLRHSGPDEALGGAVSWLYRVWLPASGVERRHAPLFFQRVQFYPFVPTHEAVTDIFMPIK